MLVSLAKYCILFVFYLYCIFTPRGHQSFGDQLYPVVTHTRQEWIIIWSGRNWILKHANAKTQPDAGTSSWPSWISHFTGSFVGHSPSEMLCPPALNLELERERTKEEKEREVLHLFRCYTHTHPAGAGSTLKGKRKKKADTRRANGQKQRRGGKGNRRTSGTNLHGETDLTKTAHTPKPHNTLRRGTRGKLGTKWGTS